MRFIIFGDSITQGLWDSKGGWADRLKAHVQENELQSGLKTHNEVFNLGVDADTTVDVLKRFESETKVRLWPKEEVVFIFALGVNDSLSKNGDEFQSTPQEYANNLNSLLNLAKKHSSNIMFVDIAPVDEALTNPLASSSSGKNYTNQRISEFNKVLHNFCRENSLVCINTSVGFGAHNYKLMLADGLHPNDQGHELIFNLVLTEINHLLPNVE